MTKTLALLGVALVLSGCCAAAPIALAAVKTKTATATTTPSSTATTTIEVPSWFGQAWTWVAKKSGGRWEQLKGLGDWLMVKGQSLLDQQDAIRAIAVERFGEFQSWLVNFLGWGKPELPKTPAE
ncbi:MAG TPA: hypothetical protein VMC43_00355 [Candidatus Paceibacterota bacterium]|nr:hypothetical protein [Candidatus Paceibacterota bacterium]